MGMERRPHWTDDLIEKVAEALWSGDHSAHGVHAVIATVEDWQLEHGVNLYRMNDGKTYVTMLDVQRMDATFRGAEARAEKAEAAIQRVRGVIDQKATPVVMIRGGGPFWVVERDHLIRALDGDGDA